MNKYNDLELSVLSCLLQRPELMKDHQLKEEYFIKHKKIWNFMNAFYQRFGNFDLTLMMAVSKNKYRMIEYIAWLLDQEPCTSLFKEYSKELKRQYELKQSDKIIIDKIFTMANDLFVGNIDLSTFEVQYKKIIEKRGEE